MPFLSRRRFVCLCVLLLSCLPLIAADPKDWTTQTEPFRIGGNLYYVGSRDLAAFLIATPDGNILINSNLESSPALIRASVEKLGFKWADTRILLNSQAHSDHFAGAAAVHKQTGAKVMVMEGDALVAENGDLHDFSDIRPYPPVHVDRVLHDRDTVELGGTKLVAHKTAGHTRGCTTWTMQVTEKGRTLNVVIVGGVSALDDYRLISTPGRPASYTGIQQDFEQTFKTLKDLPCDIFLGGHGQYFNMLAKLARMPQEGEAVWIDPAGYQAFVKKSKETFEEKLAEQRKAALR